jgi:chromate reductase
MDAVNQPEVMIGNAQERFDAQGNLIDEQSKQLIKKLIRNLVDKARQLAEARAHALAA